MIATLSPLQSKLVDDAAFPGDGAHAIHAEHVHDPTIVFFQGQYVCFSTSGNGFGVVRTSKDMLEWKVWGPVLTDFPGWLQKRYTHQSIWAPDIVVLGDKLRMIYCASDFGTNKSVIGVAECEHFDTNNPTKGWVDRGLILESNPGRDVYNAIDPEVLIDEDGKHWMFFGSYFGGIYVVGMDPKTGKLLPGKPVLVAKNTGSKVNALEGAAVKRHADYYYLLVSYGLAAQGIRSTYEIMVGRSKSPTGPFLDAEGKSMAEGGHLNVLKTSAPMISPGHCDLTQDAAGNWIMPYHFYDCRHYWTDGKWGLPTLQVREIKWSPDGWPLPGLPVEWLGQKVLPVSQSVVGNWIHQSNFTEPSEVEFKADHTFTSAQGNGTWKQENELLELNWPQKDAPGGYWTDRVKLFYNGNYYVGRNQTGMVVRAIRAGL